MNGQQSQSTSNRRGAAMLVVVIAVVVAAMLTATLTQAALVQRRQRQIERDRLQTLWLVESGVDRGLMQSQRDPDYTGEDWRPNVPGHATPQVALVAIRIVRTDATAHLEVTAEYPAGAVYRSRLHRERPLPASSSTSAEAPRSATSPENVVP